MNVSLTPRLEDFVRHKVTSGLYNNASEVIREALRLLVERDRSSEIDRRAAPVAADVRARLAELEGPLRERKVQSLALFGSLPRGQADPESDVDVLVEIESGARFSLIDLAALKDFLEGKLGREVDVVTRAGLDPALREDVFAQAEHIF